ncbi:hypothetical protein [Streptomyces dysideae]|nr:hypothetical protein [Streptomyces dysideae]
MSSRFRSVSLVYGSSRTDVMTVPTSAAYAKVNRLEMYYEVFIAVL